MSEVKRDKKQDRELIFKFLKFTKPYVKFHILAFLCVILTTLLALPMPLITKYIVDKLIPNKMTSMINLVILLIVVMYVLRAVFSSIVKYVYGYLSNKISLDIRKIMFKQVQSLSLSYLNKQASGSIASRIMNDVSTLNNFLTSSLIDIITNLLNFTAILVILIKLNWKLTILNIVTIPLFWIVYRSFRLKLRENSKLSQEQAANVMGKLYESIVNQKIIRAFNSKEYQAVKFISELKKLIKIHLKGTKLNAVSSQITFLIIAFGPIFVMWIGAKEVISGNLSIGGLFAFTQYLNQVYSPIQGIVGFNMQVQSVLGCMERIDEFLNLKVEDDESGIVLENITGEISFKSVSFSYGEEENKVLDNINFKIKPGEFIGIVGESGAGKTTISNLLMKFYNVEHGEILIDDYNLKDIQKKSYIEKIGIVTQEPYLFNATIEDNIRLGRLDATSEEVIEAAKMAQIDNFISTLPEQYKTLVDERGVNLSGGQKQRISIARVLLKNPKIVIFDEATSSLDSNSENLIQLTVEKKLKGTTRIVIAHRLSTIVNADRIFVLENGRICECGNHNELIAKKGAYYQLYSQQKEEMLVGF